VALASSLAQGVTAILLVGAGLWLLDWSRDYMTDLAERLLQPLGFAAIARSACGWSIAVCGDAVGARGRRQSHDHPSSWGTTCTGITITTITITA
jgi:ABC-type nickel/cobalt efflux system permease component RcnA